ncbi:hypothetical protein FDP41_006844 [Naegleria fowleri]|uniref:CCHC-type domain-containing protein n=1 Tax=Naegleria fowleri TaxID=5763 RepID=A0A6A5BJN9_NAEFO|nr:uncharacterized protein FDP41_006844 [Naegleria fowleri]KAF0974234.1 hypothetical protein FDP41_006844 [Naegleria fowleri]CAG4713082.1 unnamed protein product [Naegleria fowleri]
MAKKKQGEASSSTTSPNTFQNKPKFKLLKEQIKQQKVTQKLNKSAAATTTSGSSGKKSTSSVNKTSSIQIPILEISDKNLTDASPSSEEEQVENIDENIRLDLSLQCGSKSEYEFVCKTCGGEHDEEKCTNNYCPNCLEKHKLENCPHAKAGANVCEWCNKKGHTQVKCPMKQYIISKDDIPENVICFVCGEKGHLNCSTSYKSFSNKKYCFNCGQQGHSGLDCEDIKFDDILATCLKDQNYYMTASDSFLAKRMVEKYKYN